VHKAHAIETMRRNRKTRVLYRTSHRKHAFYGHRWRAQSWYTFGT